MLFVPPSAVADSYAPLDLKELGGDDRVGGAERFKTVVDALEREHGINPLVLFSGDFVAPSLVSTFTFGRHMVEIFNLLGVHYGCFGNHELDHGLEPGTDGRGLKAILNAHTDVDADGRARAYYPPSRTRWICSNLQEANGEPLAGAVRTEVVNWHSSPTGDGGDAVRVGLFSIVYDFRGRANKHNLVPLLLAALLPSTPRCRFSAVPPSQAAC